MNEETWSPSGFLAYREHFPRTPRLDPLPDPSTTRAFADVFAALGSIDDAGLRARCGPFAATTTVVFVRGYLGGFMPGNLVGPCRAARRAGFDALVAPMKSGGTIEENVARLGALLDRRTTRSRLVFCGHSKGGLESLVLLRGRPDLAARCDGVLLSQTPRGPSRVLECLIESAHDATLTGPLRRAAVAVQRGGLRAMGGVPGGRELIGPRIFDVTAGLAAERPFPIMQTSSWSTRPTSWLDSFHERLGEIRPGVAHDGQFYLEDLLWPGLPHVLLPHVDHAQPVMGGFGFPHERYWSAMLVLLLELHR